MLLLRLRCTGKNVIYAMQSNVTRCLRVFAILKNQGWELSHTEIGIDIESILLDLKKILYRSDLRFLTSNGFAVLYKYFETQESLQY